MALAAQGAHLRDGCERGFQAVEVVAAQAAVALQKVYHLFAAPLLCLVAHLAYLQGQCAVILYQRSNPSLVWPHLLSCTAQFVHRIITTASFWPPKYELHLQLRVFESF